jgi:hypothetical protein
MGLQGGLEQDLAYSERFGRLPGEELNGFAKKYESDRGA